MCVNTYLWTYTYTYISKCVIIHVYVTIGICGCVYLYICAHMSASDRDAITMIIAFGIGGELEGVELLIMHATKRPPITSGYLMIHSFSR